MIGEIKLFKNLAFYLSLLVAAIVITLFGLEVWGVVIFALLIYYFEKNIFEPLGMKEIYYHIIRYGIYGEEPIKYRVNFESKKKESEIVE